MNSSRESLRQLPKSQLHETQYDHTFHYDIYWSHDAKAAAGDTDCRRYPDLFAAGIPLGSTYGHLTLLENLRHVPMFYVQGADDGPIHGRADWAEISALDEIGPFAEVTTTSDIDSQRTYSVACVEGLLSRGDMLNLAGRFGKIEYEERELTNITAVWRYIDKQDGIINAQLDGRVRDVTKK